MEQSHSWTANRASASQDIPRILWNTKVQHRTQKRPPPIPILNQIKYIPCLPSNILKTLFNIIYPSMRRSSKWSLYFSSSHESPLCMSPVSHKCHISRASMFQSFLDSEAHFVVFYRVKACSHVSEQWIFGGRIRIPNSHVRDWDSSAGVATPYGLDGPGIESRWKARFSAPVQNGPGAHPAFYTMVTGSFQGENRPERDFDHLPLSSADVKERVALYLYSPSGFSCPVLGWT